MIADNYTGYGMRDGELVFIEDVPRGLACGCVCARCGKTLIAKKGPIRQDHFAHSEAADCHGATESVLHLLAKELIAELDVFVVPQYEFVKHRTTRTGRLVQHQVVVAKGGNVHIRSVRVEENASGFVPDIIIESGSKSLIVEVAVTHKVDRAKLRRLRRRNWPAIEIRLDPEDAFLSREQLKQKLQQDLALKVWLFHPDQRQEEQIFVSKFRDVLAYDRARSHQTYRIKSHQTWGQVLRQSSLSEYDRTQEQFREKYGRYPNLEECLQLWPHLWKPRA